MSDYLIAERYARALGEVIEDDGALDAVAADLDALCAEVSDHHDLHACLSNPAIDAGVRKRVLDGVLDKMEARPEVRGLVHELLSRRRIALLPLVARAFGEIADARQGRVTARVKTALPMTSAQEAELQASLSAYTGKDVRLQSEVDPDLLSGVVAYVGGEVIDDSLRTRLTNLKNALVLGELA